MNPHSKPPTDVEQGSYRVGANSYLNRDSAFEMRHATCPCAAPPEPLRPCERRSARRGDPQLPGSYPMAAAAYPGPKDIDGPLLLSQQQRWTIDAVCRGGGAGLELREGMAGRAMPDDRGVGEPGKGVSRARASGPITG